MTVVRLSGPAEFLALVTPLLVRHEVENGILLGVAADALEMSAPPAGALWAVGLDRGEPLVAALRTGDKLLVSREARPGAAAMLAETVLADGPPALLGPAEVVRSVVERISALAGIAWVPGTPQRIYECRQVLAPSNPSGEMRVVSAEEEGQILDWVRAFEREAMGRVSPSNELEARIRPRLASGAYFVWVDEGDVVSMAGAFGPTPHGIRIGAVYTPERVRGRGYASALTAGITQRMLDSGRDFTFLYTDLRNPTSNRIYRAIGYVPVADPVELAPERV